VIQTAAAVLMSAATSALAIGGAVMAVGRAALAAGRSRHATDRLAIDGSAAHPPPTASLCGVESEQRNDRPHQDNLANASNTSRHGERPPRVSKEAESHGSLHRAMGPNDKPRVAGVLRAEVCGSCKHFHHANGTDSKLQSFPATGVRKAFRRRPVAPKEPFVPVGATPFARRSKVKRTACSIRCRALDPKNSE
jgi:hypothetical protein